MKIVMVAGGTGGHIYPAMTLAQALIEKGHQIWHDKNIIPGDEWVESVADNLKNASGCLLFLSPDALESANVRREIHYCKRQVLFPKKRHFIFLKCGKLFS